MFPRDLEALKLKDPVPAGSLESKRSERRSFKCGERLGVKSRDTAMHKDRKRRGKLALSIPR